MMRTVWVLCASAGCALPGCTEPPSGHSVTGNITLHGEPLDQGMIEFSPAAGQGTMSGGMIKDGAYTIPPESGLAPGLYQVRISSTQGAAPNPDELPGEARTPPKQRIPAQYNTETTLQAEVKAGGDNHFDFAIP
jgi:hypothetical protein